MLDCIFIDGLEAQTTIGTLAWEQAAPQTVVLQLSLWVDTSKAAISDDLSHSIDYSEVCNFILAWCAARKTLLIEKLSNDLADALLERYPVPKLTLTLRKPGAIKAAKGVGITLTRERG